MFRKSSQSLFVEFVDLPFFRITEAQNECRDKTKFLESIRRYLENLTEDVHPQNCAVNILPALCDAMRTVESVSRYYARQGYLGLIFSKVSFSHLPSLILSTSLVDQVTNQLVKICKHHIGDDLAELWAKLFEEIQSGNVIDDIKENFHLDKKVRRSSGESRSSSRSLV